MGMIARLWSDFAAMRRVHRLRLRGSRSETTAVQSMHFVSRGETGREQWY